MNNITQQLLSQAKKLGATQADVMYIKSTQSESRVLNQKPDIFETASSDAIGLRVLVGQKQSVVRTSNFDDSSLNNLVEKAIEMAKSSPEDPYTSLANQSLWAKDIDAKIKELQLADSTLNPSAKDLQEKALTVEAAGRENSKVSKSGGAWANSSYSEMTFATSEGFEGTYSATSYSLGAEMIAGSGNDMVAGYHYKAGRHLNDMESPEKIGAKAAQKTVEKIGAKSKGLGRVPVIFNNEMSSAILSELASAINGAAIAKDTSYLKELMNKSVFSDEINIIDNPILPKGLASHPFDGEGVNCQERNIIENGVLKSWILDLTTANKLNLQTTGHASRGAGSLPSPSCTNFYMENGTSSVEDFIQEAKDGFYVTGLIGHGGANPVTGDYSIGAEGFLIENGKLTSPIDEVTLAGNMIEIFKTLKPANDLEFNSRISAPTLYITGMTVGGK